MRPTIKTTTTDASKKLKADLARIAKSQVLVGIPEATSERKGPEFKIGRLTFKQAATVNNAELAWIHSNGSPAQGIPARPFLQPSINANQELIAEQLGAAAKAYLDQNPEEADKRLAMAGIVAANGAKRYIQSGDDLAPNSPATIARKGSSKALIDTGQLLRSITSVVVHPLDE